MVNLASQAGAVDQGRPKRARKTIDVALAILVAAGVALPGPGKASANGPGETTSAPGWEWGPSILWYVLPQEADYLQPTLTVDRGALHLEGRYNYEARNAGSIWVGWNFSFGDGWKLGLTPMVGGVFGQMQGIAPGFTVTLEWGPLAFWSQGEYVFDLADSSQSYAYVWSELGITGPEWLRVGLVLQRTRAFQTSTAFQGGPLVGFNVWQLSATAYFFAPGQEDQFLVLALAGAF
jgi:hypothetical protein